MRSPRWFSWQPRNLLTLGREFESRCSHTNWKFYSQKKKKKKKSCPTNGERLIRGYKKIDFTVDEGKGRLKSFKHRRRKVEKSCVTFLLCDPGWCVHKSDVQNKWDDLEHIYVGTVPGLKRNLNASEHPPDQVQNLLNAMTAF